MFKIGDRVVLVDKKPPGACDNRFLNEGYCGTVVNLNDALDHNWVGVQWDDEIFGHSCGGFAKDGFGWNVHMDAIEHMDSIDLPQVNDHDLLSLLGE